MSEIDPRDAVVKCPECGSEDTWLEYYHDSEGGAGVWGRVCYSCRATSDVSDWPYYGTWEGEGE